MFSSIVERFDAPTNRLYELRDQLRAEGKPFVDLVSGNVNTQGIVFPANVLQKALAEGIRKSKIYKADPLGQIEARRAISRFYASGGLKIDPGQILLTPGTSISYWYAFKVLADAGDEILCPVPCYPLFDSIAALCGITLRPYRLNEANRWEIDFDHLEAGVTPKTKAIVLISPHNPTGAVASESAIRKLAELAERKGLAIISDEVFSPFLFPSSPADSGRGTIVSPPTAAGNDGQGVFPRPASTKAPLVITLNGLSKMLALPGLKIGWMAVTGDPVRVKKTMKALDMISDTFLPVNEMAQFAVPSILLRSKSFQRQYKAQIQERLDITMDLLKEAEGISCIRPEGGFFLTLKLNRDEDSLALRLLREHRVLVHPGYFYDMDEDHLIMSFISRPAVLRKAIAGLIR